MRRPAALADMLRSEPLTIEMSDYAGFEKVGSLGTRLPASNAQTTTSSGDIVLYNGSQIVIFYGSNSWSYTRLGRIDDLDGWADALGSGDVTVTFSLAEKDTRSRGPDSCPALFFRQHMCMYIRARMVL